VAFDVVPGPEGEGGALDVRQIELAGEDAVDSIAAARPPLATAAVGLIGDGLDRLLALEGEDGVTLDQVHLDVVGGELVDSVLTLAVVEEGGSR